MGATIITTIVTCVITTLLGMLIGYLVSKTKKTVKDQKVERKALEAILRHEIVTVYYQFKEVKNIPYYLKESILIIFEVYEALGGNSFVKQIIAEIKTWVVVD